MNALFKNIKQDKLLERGFLLNFILILLSIIYILLYLKSLPPFIPIFDQMPWGDQRIAQTIWLFLIPLLSFSVFAVNLTFSSFIYKRNVLVARLFSVTSFLFSILSFLFIVRTIHTVL